MSDFDHLEIINRIWFERRDIISDGFDKALNSLKEYCPEINIQKYPTGSKVWTWTIPPKWQVKEAWIKSKDKKIVDVKDHPLHVMSYSIPVNETINHADLMKRIHTIPECPDAIPFEFSYYKEQWGFCVEHNRLPEFNCEEYEVFINSSFEEGELKVGEIVIPGEYSREVVLISHLCHPCQVDDDLTGVVALLSLQEKIKKLTDCKYTYRILIVPETIGTIAYLANNEEIIEKVDFGICLGSLGNNNNISLQRSRQNNSWIDLAAENVLKENCSSFRIGNFGQIIGNDEKVLDSPGVNIPTISLTRCNFWSEGHRPFYEYHSSKDTPAIICIDRILEVEGTVQKILSQLESNFFPIANFRGPVFFSSLDLWIDPRENSDHMKKIYRLTELLHQKNISLIEIANELEISFETLMEWIQKFERKNLISRKSVFHSTDK